MPNGEFVGLSTAGLRPCASAHRLDFLPIFHDQPLTFPAQSNAPGRVPTFKDSIWPGELRDAY